MKNYGAITEAKDIATKEYVDNHLSGSLDDLTDVTITTPTSGQLLQYNGTDWVNGSSSSGVTSVNGETGAVTLSLGDIDSVALTSPTSGQVLMYNGTNWVNTTIGDYVIEQGTNGIWTYKKWLNGSIEIRGTYATTTSYAITTAYGGIYRYASRFDITMPLSLVDFNVNSEVFVSVNGSGLDFAGSVTMTSANALSFWWCNPTSYTCAAGAKIQYYVVGQWK